MRLRSTVVVPPVPPVLFHFCNSAMISLVRLPGISVVPVCRFPVTAAAWPSVRQVRRQHHRNMLLVMATPESTSGTALPGRKWVLVSLLRGLITKTVAFVWRFPMTAAAWPSLRRGLMYSNGVLESTNGRALPGSRWAKHCILPPGIIITGTQTIPCRFPMMAAAWPSV